MAKPGALLLLLASAACGTQSAADPSHPTPPASAAAPSPASVPPAAATRITVEGVSIPVALDAASIDAQQGNTSEVVARRGERVLLIDSWASKPQSLSRCQAGRERWLRLVDLSQKRELFSKLVESCLRDVEPGDPIATWPEGSDTIHVDLLSEPAFNLRADGAIVK